MSVHATCPQCGEEFRRPDKMAGELEKCPECRFVFRLPFAATFPAPEDAEAEPSPEGLLEHHRHSRPAMVAEPSVLEESEIPLIRWKDVSPPGQTWEGEAVFTPADALPNYESAPSHSSRQDSRGSRRGRKLLFAVGLVVLVIALGFGAALWFLATQGAGDRAEDNALPKTHGEDDRTATSSGQSDGTSNGDAASRQTVRALIDNKISKDAGQRRSPRWSEVSLARLTVVVPKDQRVPSSAPAAPTYSKEEFKKVLGTSFNAALVAIKHFGCPAALTSSEGTLVLTLYISPETSHFWPPDTAALDGVKMWGTTSLPEEEPNELEVDSASHRIDYNLSLSGRSKSLSVIVGTADGIFAGTKSIRLKGVRFTLEPVVSRHGLGPTALPPKQEFVKADYGNRPAKHVRIKNPNAFGVTVAVRAGAKGTDHFVLPFGTDTMYLPSGRLDVYFAYSCEPGKLFQGESLTLNSEGDEGAEIQIIKAVDGNYGVREVE
jgi:hypothetical protein